MFVCQCVRGLPEYNDESIEDVEAVLDVAERTVPDDLEQHLKGEDGTEEDITVLQDQGQRLRLQG